MQNPMCEIRQLQVQFNTLAAVTFILKGLSDVICPNACILTQIVISHAARKRCALCVSPVGPRESRRTSVVSSPGTVTFDADDTGSC